MSGTHIETVQIEIPNGYEFVRYGAPEAGELFLAPGDGIVVAAFEKLANSRIIVRKKFDPVEWWGRHSWLKCDFVFKNERGEWNAGNRSGTGTKDIDPHYFDFTPPPEGINTVDNPGEGITWAT